MHAAHRARALLATALVLGSVAGCGARTGLEVPDAGDGGFDGGPAAPDAPDATDAAVPCFELDPDGGVIDLPLDTQVELGRADVAFLVDTTASMGSEIDQIRRGLRDRIVPGIRASIPDSRLAVATFADFPNDPCGDTGDSPFELILPITDDISRVQAAVDSIALHSGVDPPESQVEGLFQLVTGEGLPGFVEPSFGCPGGGFGFACFSADALPVVLLFTDAPFHSGPGGTNPYTCGVSGVAHRYDDAVAALRARNVRVIGLFSGGGDAEARRDLDAIARDTGAVGATGAPLVLDIGSGGERLSESVVDAIEILASVIEFDIDTRLSDPDPGDAVDPRDFVDAVLAIRAEPPEGAGEIDRDAGVFRRVRTGTRVLFQLRLRNDAVAPGEGPQRFRLEIIFRADMRTRIGSTIVEIVVPGRDGTGCGPL